ncbi:lipopolysaccharide assembly LapA domain-containing protein [Caenispirillum salinarum]|uniref:LapA family protein n=1 Tax=Caenispirillum salinarum TaxID=859058 RepID=UPI003850E335
MKLIRWLIGLPLAAVAIIFAVSNRQMVTVELWPFPWTADLPLYLLSLGTLAVGIVIGALFAWTAGSHKRAQSRSEKRHQEIRIRNLEHENEQLKAHNERLTRESEPQRSLPAA